VRWLAIAVILVTLVFVGAGCGGGSNEASSDTETITSTDTVGSEDTSADETSTEGMSTDETDTSGMDTSGTDTNGTFNWASEDCQNLVKAYVGLSAAVAAASSGQDVSPEIEKFAKYEDEVPDEIRADVKTVASAYGEFLDKLKGTGYTPGQIPTADQLQQLQDASKSLDDPAVQAAGERISTWTSKNCSG
jgi:hypothetical protein